MDCCFTNLVLCTFFSLLILYKTDIFIISSKCELFSPWYRYTIAIITLPPIKTFKKCYVIILKQMLLTVSKIIFYIYIYFLSASYLCRCSMYEFDHIWSHSNGGRQVLACTWNVCKLIKIGAEATGFYPNSGWCNINIIAGYCSGVLIFAYFSS